MAPVSSTLDAADQVLADLSWLERHLHDASVRVVEVDVSAANYDAGHIDGAVLWNVYQDLKDANYQLADTATIERLLARSGIAAGTTVVFYGYAPAMGFWLMRLYRHVNIRVLNCARETWRDDGRPWTTTAAHPAPTHYRLPGPDAHNRAQQADVYLAIRDASSTLIDVRTEAEFRGERFWPSGGNEPTGRAGHIPSARNLSIDGLYDERGTYRRPADLHRVFAAIDATDDRDLITYCTIGGRACTAWFALSFLLGRHNVRVYDGSWAEWGRMPHTPVASQRDSSPSHVTK
jgi:thiosulfate/3-mercaptopyruvate sulfurtransferase